MKLFIFTVMVTVLGRVAAAQLPTPTVRGNRTTYDWGSSQLVVQRDFLAKGFSGDDIEKAARADAKTLGIERSATVSRLGSKVVIHVLVKPTVGDLVFLVVAYIPTNQGATRMQFWVDGEASHWQPVATTLIEAEKAMPARSVERFGPYLAEVPRRVRVVNAHGFDRLGYETGGCLIGEPAYVKAAVAADRAGRHGFDRAIGRFWLECVAESTADVLELEALLATMRRRAKLDTLERIHALLE